MNKIPFVMLSGGLDSTYLLYTMLRRHKEVVVVNSVILSNPCITARQEEAVRNILNKMEEFHREGKVIGRVIRVIPISIPGVSLGLSRVPMSVWWGAVGTAVIDDSTENFYLGYVKGDKASSTFHHLKEAWPHLLRVAKFDTNPIRKLPDLVAPLINVTKAEIISKIPQELLGMITWCDSRYFKDDCGNCWSCLGMVRGIRGFRELKSNQKLDEKVAKRFDRILAANFTPVEMLDMENPPPIKADF